MGKIIIISRLNIHHCFYLILPYYKKLYFRRKNMDISKELFNFAHC